jgi:hypothetical protein
MATSIRPSLIASAFVIVVLLATATSGCSSLLGDAKPSVTLTAPYKEPTPTPMPCPTPVPAISTSWNGLYAKLHGNVSVEEGEHVYGTIKVNYLEQNYWEEHPTAQYDTDDGGAYSLDVRANVPFKVDIGYLYKGQLPEVMSVRYPDDIYKINEDTVLDLDVMTSNITPHY